MAGTCTVTDSRDNVGVHAANKEELSVISWAWTSAADGTVSGQGAQGGITGRIEQVRFIPGSGADAPSDPHSVYLYDEYGVDVLMATGVGQGADPAVSTTIQTPFNTNNSYVYLLNATLTPGVTGAGNAKSGTIVLVVR